MALSGPRSRQPPLFAARLPPALCRWSHNWRATGVRCEAATGPVPVEPQLACYQAFAARLPPALCRWSTTGVLPGDTYPTAPARNRDRNPARHRDRHSAAGCGLMWPRNAAGLMVSATLGHCESGSIAPWTALAAAPLRLSRAGIDGPFRAQKQAATPVRCEAATGPVPVEPQLVCCRRAACAGGATTGVLPGVRCEAATGPVPVEPQLACYQAHTPIADGRVDTYPTHRHATATAIRARHRDRHSAAGCGLMWPRNAAGLMVSATLGHCESGSIAPWTALAAAPLRLSRAGIDGPFRAQKQAATPVRCEAATGPAPVEPQLVCYQAFAARLPPALCRWSHNWCATSVRTRQSPTVASIRIQRTGTQPRPQSARDTATGTRPQVAG